MILADLALALGIGLLVGMERGWKQRDAPDEGRVAGLRTFALIGLFGGLCGLLSTALGALVLFSAFLTMAAVLAAAYAHSAGKRGDIGLTTEIAALVTFSLGALAARGYQKEAAVCAVVVTALLGFKPMLHGWLARVGRPELEAALKFLLISVAVLPNLPDRGFGPWDAINPYQIWWMVVLIAGISFAGYVSVKLLGSKGGLFATSVLGGLISSTAVTLSLARADRRQPRTYLLHAAGIVVASTVMFPRILVEVAAVNPSLLRLLVPSFVAMAGVGFAGAGLLMWRSEPDGSGHAPVFKNPLELGAALFFGGLLAVVTVASVALKQKFGESGVYATALTAGLMDVDAVTLSLSRLAAAGRIEPETAANGIITAAAANQVAKSALAAAVAQARLGLCAAGVLLASLAAGGAVLWAL